MIDRQVVLDKVNPTLVPRDETPRQQRPAPSRVLNLARGAGLARPAHRPREEQGGRRPGRGPEARQHARALRGARRPAAPAAHGPPHRHQRQGLGGPHGHRAARRPRPHGRHLHEPAPRADQRADLPQRRADHATRRWPPCSPTWPASSRCSSTSRPTSSCSRRRRSAGSPTRPWPRPSSRWGCSGAGTPPTSSTAWWRCSPTSATTTPTAQGDWRRRIAEEKAGIVKAGATFVLGETDPALADVFDGDPRGGGVAARRRLRLHRQPARGRRPAARPAHAGRHLRRGVPRRSTAPTRARTPPSRLAAAEAFFGRPLDAGPRARGLRGASRNPGRFEVVQHDPLLILDGAHNPDGAQAVVETLAEGFVVTGDTPPRHRRARRARPRRAPRDPRRRGRGRGRLLHARLAAGAARPPTLAEHVARARRPRPA